MDGIGLHQDSVAYQCIRELLLSTGTRDTKVARELWCGPFGTYQAYRQYLRKTVQRYGFPSQRAPGLLPPDNNRKSTDKIPRKPTYAFTGVEHVFDCSKHPITLMAYASLSSSLLAFVNSAGGVWVMQLSTNGEELQVHQMEYTHEKAVTGLDWSFDNTLLLTCSADGSVYLWSPTTSTSPIRTLTVRGGANCCRFHPTNPNLVLVGTSKSAIEIFNASTGSLVLRQPIPTAGGEVTALVLSPHHILAGDSNGTLHMLSSLLKGGVLQRLSPQHRLHAALSPQSRVTALGLLPCCASADNCPVVLVSCLDSTLAVIKITEQGKAFRLEPHSLHVAPRMARPIIPQWCPSLHLHTTTLSHTEYVAMGSEDTNVYIYDVAKHNAASSPVASLQGHCAPTTAVAWTFDERFLASGDCNGMVIVWKRDEASLHSLPSSRPPSSSASQPTTPRSSLNGGTYQVTPRTSLTSVPLHSRGSPMSISMSRTSSANSLATM